jgi:4-hydroxybenzoate polyprenyltransferase
MLNLTKTAINFTAINGEKINNYSMSPIHFMNLSRVHHWPKNFLVFFPLFASHEFSFSSIVNSFLCFLGFCFCASSIYIVNDFFDLPHDRTHPEKRHRPLAAGIISPASALTTSFVALCAALGLGWLAGPGVVLVIVGYAVVAIAYSMILKRAFILDALTLTCLYGARLAAGAVACGVALSSWLIAFSSCLFFGLALVKRVSEIASRQQAGLSAPPGRPYRLSDRLLLERLSAIGCFAAVVILALYSESQTAASLYASPKILWGAVLALAVWVCRLLALARRNALPDDPVAFALSDRVSYLCGAFIALCGVAAAMLS